MVCNDYIVFRKLIFFFIIAPEMKMSVGIKDCEETSCKNIYNVI